MPAANPPNPQSYYLVTNVRKKESAYGTIMSDTDLPVDSLIVTEANYFDIVPTYRDDGKEVNHYAGATTHEIEKWDGSKDFKSYFSPQIYQWLLAHQLANITTTGAGDPYSHANKWPNICTSSPPSTSILEAPGCAGQTADYLAYKGVMVDETDVTINGLSTLELTAKFMSDGSETSKSSLVIPATDYTVKKLIGANVVLKLGPLGTEDISTDFRSSKINIKSSLARKAGVSAGLYAPGFIYGENAPVVTWSFVIVGDKSHPVFGYMKSKTVLICDLLVDPAVSPARLTRWHSSQCIVKCKEVPAGSESHLQIDVMCEFNATDSGPMKITNVTQEPSYLTASS